VRKRSFGWCSHETTITTITAGLARDVCEACGRVRLQYVERAVRIYPSGPNSLIDAPVQQSGPSQTTARKCRLCSQPAVFMIPDGMSCDEHAWQAAARTNWDDADPWVPIRIDRSNA
jgi:hypothetical protein